MRPLVVSLLVALSTGLLVFAAFFLRPRVDITAEPAEAKITFAGEDSVGRGSFVVLPGRFELTIEHPDFIPLKKTELLRMGQRWRLDVVLKPLPVPQPLSGEPVLLVGLTKDNGAVMFIGNRGRTLFAHNEKETKLLTGEVFKNPLFFKFSPGQDVALFKNPNGDVFIHDFKRYDLIRQDQLFYGRDIGDIDWVYPEGERLLYAYAPKSGEQSLVLSDRSNKSPERVFNLRESNITNPAVAVAPNGKSAILISRPGSDYKLFNLFLFDLVYKRPRQLTTDGSKVAARFSPSGKYLVFTRFEAGSEEIGNQFLSVMDTDGKNRKDFPIRTTLDQIDFLDENRLVVAASEKGGSVLYELDLISGQQKTYYHRMAEPIFFGRLLLAGDKKSVFVTGSLKPKDKYGTLFKIKLETDEYIDMDNQQR